MCAEKESDVDQQVRRAFMLILLVALLVHRLGLEVVLLAAGVHKRRAELRALADSGRSARKEDVEVTMFGNLLY